MVRRYRLLRSSALVAAAVIGVSGLAACNRSGDSGAATQASAADALPLTTAAAEPTTRAPSADALPAATPARVRRAANRDEDYAYLDQAYHQGDAFEDAPPDYAFDYDGVRPWAWRGAYGQEFVEPAAGGWRYYYYRQGASTPYLVREGGYAYGYDNGELVVVYDRQGRLLPRDQIDRRADLAGRYLTRAEGLLRASRAADRRGVAAANWAAARSEIAAQRSQLSAARARESAWQAYDQAHAAEQSARWDQERNRRQDYAQRFEGWRQTNFQGAPPAPARYAAVRPAQADTPFRQEASRAAPPPAPTDRTFQSQDARRFARDQDRQAQDQADQRQGDQRRADQRQADQRQADQRQADQRQVADLQRAQAQQAQAEQARQQDVQQRQAADQARAQLAQQQQQQQQAQRAQQAQVEQGRQQEMRQRQAAEQQQRQAQQAQAQQVQAQARAQAAPQPPQQAEQQRQPQRPDQPAARPAGRDEHREHKDNKDNQGKKDDRGPKDRRDDNH